MKEKVINVMQMHLQINENGRIVIPKKIRDLLGIKNGGAIKANVIGDTLQITSVENALKKARELVKKHCLDSDISLVDDLLSMRKEEFAREQKKFDIASNHTTKTDDKHD